MVRLKSVTGNAKWKGLIEYNIKDYNTSIQELIRFKVLVYIILVSPYISENEIISLTKFLLYFSDVTTSLCPAPLYIL